MNNIKITELTNIGNNIAFSSLIPVVDMAGTPTTKKANLQLVGNLILSGAGGANFPPATRAITAQTVTNAAQPNITSVGTLTSLAVTGNITATILNVSTIANLGAVGNVRITGGTNGQVLTTNGSGGLSWTTVSGGGANTGNITFSNTTISTSIANADINILGSTSGNVHIDANNHIFLHVDDSIDPHGGVEMTWARTANGVTQTAGISINSDFGNNEVATGNVQVVACANLANGLANSSWTFGIDGKLAWPGVGEKYIGNGAGGEFEIHSNANVVIGTDIGNVDRLFVFDQSGDFLAPGNVAITGTRLNVGPGAAEAPITTNPTVVVTDSGLEFIQSALINENPNGSSDYAVYGSGSDETQGFADLGFTGPTFNDPNYSITPPGDGYVFVQGYANGLGGALTLATGENGNDPDIVFATGGFTSGAEFGRIDHGNNVLYLSRGGSGIKFSDGTIQTTAADSLTGNITFDQSNISTSEANTDIQIIGNGTGGINLQSNSSVWTFDDSGDFLAPGNVTMEGTQILVGPSATGLGLADATLVISSSSNAYLQAVINNVSDIGSADWVAQGKYGNDVAGWADLGFTSASYSDEGNSMFGPGTGYVIVNGYLPGQAPAIGTGSLILATMSEGTEKDIIFGTGGGYAENIFGRISDANNLFELSRANAGIKFTDGSIQTTAYTGGGGNTGNVTFDDVTVQGVNQLNLSWDPLATANLAYLQVRGGDVASHIHLDTGNNEAYDLIVGDDAKFVQVSSTGDIIMSSYDGNTSYTWTLDTTGNLILAGGNSVIQSIANSSSEPLYPNVSTMVFTPDALLSSQSLVLDPTGPSHIHLRAPGANIDEPDANIFLGGEESSFEVGYYNGNVPNLYIHSGGNTWTFDTTGNLTLPGNLVIAGNTSVFGTNASLLQPADNLPLLSVSSGSNGGVSSLWVEDIGNVGTSNIAAVYANPTSGSGIVRIAVGQNGVGSGPNLWDFGATGNLTLPGNTVAINFANGSAAFGNIATINLDGSNSNVLYGNGTFAAVSTSFAGEMHVSKDGNDSTGTGTILRPYLTITHALTQVTGGRDTIVIHPGEYTENPTITSTNTQLITYDATGASTIVIGTVTMANVDSRIAGLRMANLIIAGNSQAYISMSTVTEQFTKSSSGYVEVDDCELQVSGNVLISGSGSISIVGNKINNLVVNNAGAAVLVKGADDCVMPQVTAGSLNIVDSIIRASSNTANAVTASAGTVVTLMNNQIVTPAADSVARVSIAGYHSIISLVYDKANSTLSNSLNSVAYFQTANVDSLVSSGNITGAYVLGNGSGLTSLPAPTVSQDITSNGAMSIMTYDGNLKYVNYATVEPSTGNITGGNLITSGQITSTKAGNLSTGAGQLYLNGSGNNRIDFNTNGTGAPAFTTRSAGTKVVLYPSIGASATDYAVGVDSGTLWSGIPAADAGQFFKWYGGTTEVANLSGTGTLTVTGNIAGANISTTGTLTSTGKIGYASGSTVTQTSNRGNGVNINALAGTIVTVSASMTAGEIGAFSVTNNQVDTNNDIVLVQVVSPNLGNYNVIANPNSGIGGFYLTLQNISGFPISAEAVTIRFMVIKAPNA